VVGRFLVQAASSERLFLHVATLCRRSSYRAPGLSSGQLGGFVNGTSGPTNDASERLKAAIEELRGIQSLLVAGELDPRILTDFRDAVNRVRNTAWAAYQYAESKITGKDSRSIMSLVASERIRAAYQLCQAIQADWKPPMCTCKLAS
jgi:hypothetical protein